MTISKTGKLRLFMKAGKWQIILVVGIILNTPLNVAAQWEEDQINAFFSIPEIALVDIEPSLNNALHFSIQPATEAGASPEIGEVSGETLWINYSSSLVGQNNARQIIAEIAQGSMPPGIDLFVEASPYSGSGDGMHGQPSGRVNITSQQQPVLTGIGNCFTGDGINNGHSLTFSAEITDYSKIRSVDLSEVTILYTISDY